MKQFIQAINNLASSIYALATSITNSSLNKNAISKYPTTTTTTTTAINKAPASTVYQNSFSQNKHSPKRIDNKEQEALDIIYKAFTDKGPNPRHHEKALKKLRKRWPILHDGIKLYVDARLNNSSKFNKTTKDVWKVV